VTITGRVCRVVGAAGLAAALLWAFGPASRPAPVGARGPGVDDESRRAASTATFAGGCFWCVEADFDKLPGVLSTTSGYTGGWSGKPTYSQVSSGGTGHTEAVMIRFDPAVISYEQLLAHFWRNVDPFVSHRQFCDVGDQYRPEIFVHDAGQRAAAEASLARMQSRFQDRILVRITDAKPFHAAEDYHQNYHSVNPLRYRFYRWRCGRDGRLAAIWGAA
jgi:peptide-methionine (S)-S-oxide reductase